MTRLLAALALLLPVLGPSCALSAPLLEAEIHDYRCDDLRMRLRIAEEWVNHTAGVIQSALSLEVDPETDDSVVLPLDLRAAPGYLILAGVPASELGSSPSPVSPDTNVASLRPLNLFLPPAVVAPERAQRVQACFELHHASIVTTLNESALDEIRAAIIGRKVGDQRVYWKVEPAALEPVFRSGQASIRIERTGDLYVIYPGSLAGMKTEKTTRLASVRVAGGQASVTCCSPLAPRLDAAEFLDEEGRNPAEFLGVPLSEFNRIE